MTIKTYLNEELLGVFLQNNTVYNGEWIHNKKFYDKSYRPDYVNHHEKIVVEFDGYRHFSDFKTITNDYSKDDYITSKEYSIIRIPYFVQLNSSEIIKHYFNQNLPTFNDYPHGFINKTAMLPFDYNFLGVERYKNIIKNLPQEVVKQIFYSIKDKLKGDLGYWYFENFGGFYD